MDIDATLDLVERLKRAAVDYALSPGFAKRLEETRGRLGLHADSVENTVEAVESLLFEGSADKEPLLARYIRTNKALDPADRAVYEGWLGRNVFGAFRVEEQNGPELLLHNLIDEMDYRTHATAGVDASHPVPSGGYATVRVVPTHNVWTISGNVHFFKPQEREFVEEYAINLLRQFPRMPFRNPDKLERARDMVGEQHRIFMETLGTPVVLGSGSEAIEAYRSFMEAVDADAAARAPQQQRTPRSGLELAPDGNFPAELRDARDVALFHHPVKSTSFLVGYREAREAHRTPPATAADPAAVRLREYIHDESVPLHVIEDFASQFPDTVDQAYRIAFSLPEFVWERDGGALLLEHKATHVEDADIPDITTVPTSLRGAYLRLAQGA
ncbi:hypothetical protein JOF48_003294 [Arthrobacter stackebrandtii]|uniref:Uncharacterized protein n=1 Tax=Arthrobacter stackebrandtii TaxID=272161 RepID=A0ABS4Z0Z0_9MICC|nr:hypothetical protein [Arthrobacter stackebrandtii]MBP2414495.1 hypothetical protein [Arthrobacter stackebrandtii]PYH01616.1 hypothetical protein CVV67_03860 [Arthrobacter stackebrandtii]